MVGKFPGEGHGTPPALSIVCVYNDPVVRQECLDRSIAAYEGPVQVEYLPVDNRGQRFTSAGAALQDGIERARHDVVVLVHQDVHLHSIDQLARAASALADGTWSLLGASGVTHDDLYVGRLRDRLRLHGQSASEPVEVDSVDEVLFMARRDVLMREPLTQAPELDWHGYAVELGLRLRSSGLRVGAVDAAITHNSLNTNIIGLERAHRFIDAAYQQFPSTRTTCGVIGSPRRRWRHLPVVRDHGWRLRWLRESAVAAQAARHLDVPVVLGELFEDVDHLPFGTGAPLHVVNIDHDGGFHQLGGEPLLLHRRARPVLMRAVRSIADVPAVLAELPVDAHVVVEDLSTSDVRMLDDSLFDARRTWLAGLQPQGVWLLAGPASRDLPDHWKRRQAVPWGSRHGTEGHISTGAPAPSSRVMSG